MDTGSREENALIEAKQSTVALIIRTDPRYLPSRENLQFMPLIEASHGREGAAVERSSPPTGSRAVSVSVLRKQCRTIGPKPQGDARVKETDKKPVQCG